MEETLVSNNLLKLLFEEIDNKKDNLNESHLLAVLAKGLAGTLDIINANLWRVNSFKQHNIKKLDNDKEYITLLGCNGYIPEPQNLKEFVHDTEAGVFSKIFDQFLDTPYFEISLSQSAELKALHAAPERVKKFNLDHLIIVPIIDKKTTGYEWQGVLNLYVKPYDDKSREVLDSYIKSIKTIFRIGLQNIKRYHSAELFKTVIEGFKQSRTEREKNKDKTSILYFLMTELQRFIAFDTCSIFMWDPTQHKLVLKKSLANDFFEPGKNDVPLLRNPSYLPGEGKTGKVYQSRLPLIIDDIDATDGKNGKNKFLFREKTQHSLSLKSFMAVPIIHPARPLEVLGVIRLVNRLNHLSHSIVDYFSPDDYSLVNDFCSLLALHLEVEQSEKMRKAFAKHMEHEISGPITSIKNDADRISFKKTQNRLQDWQLDENLKHIVDTAKLLESITQNVQYTWKDSEDVSRNELYPEIVQVSFLKDILEPAREVVIPLLRESDFKPKEIVFKGNDFKIYVDKEALIQVFVNLFSNAIKYRDNAARLTSLVVVTWENDPNQPIQINVTDNGRGIAKENKERVFDFGFREIEATQTNVRGLGIGLSVVKNIINDFHSTINITSIKNPTNFCISLSAKLNGIGYTREAEWSKKTK